MMEGISVLFVALFLAVVNERLVEWFVSPVFEKYKWDTMWLRYVAGVTGFLISFFGNINLLATYVDNPWLGLVLTGLVVGGGSNLVHELFSANTKRGLLLDETSHME